MSPEVGTFFGEDQTESSITKPMVDILQRCDAVG